MASSGSDQHGIEGAEPTSPRSTPVARDANRCDGSVDDGSGRATDIASLMAGALRPVLAGRGDGTDGGLRQIADLTESFIAKTIVALCAIDNVIASEGATGAMCERRSTEVKARLEALEDLLMQLRAAEAKAS